MAETGRDINLGILYDGIDLLVQKPSEELWTDEYMCNAYHKCKEYFDNNFMEKCELLGRCAIDVGIEAKLNVEWVFCIFDLLVRSMLTRRSNHFIKVVMESILSTRYLDEVEPMFILRGLLEKAMKEDGRNDGQLAASASFEIICSFFM